ncbi:MAG: hypothetical protein AVDCRST_MAG66-1388, partial [uncultured Pseudonocardia sp.]
RRWRPRPGGWGSRWPPPSTCWTCPPSSSAAATRRSASRCAWRWPPSCGDGSSDAPTSPCGSPPRTPADRCAPPVPRRCAPSWRNRVRGPPT